LFGGLAAVALLLYGLIPWRASARIQRFARESQPSRARRTANDLVIGSGGILLAVILISGLAVTAGWGWAALGTAMLAPMLAGCAYLVAAFARAPNRDWTVDLHRLFRSRIEH
jgi:hypothetical protein